MTLGEKIKGLREDKRLSIRELGRRTDVTGMHISNLEKGKINASPELLVKIAKVLDTDADELLHMADRVDPEVIDVIQNNPQAVPSFLRSAKDLSPEDWEKVQKYMERMKSQKSPVKGKKKRGK
jgi:HTH-type transcriptional regulator, competence development regulator